MVGDVGIQEELDLKGINHIGGPADKDQIVELKPGYALPHDHDVSRVKSSPSESIWEQITLYTTTCDATLDNSRTRLLILEAIQQYFGTSRQI